MADALMEAREELRRVMHDLWRRGDHAFNDGHDARQKAAKDLYDRCGDAISEILEEADFSQQGGIDDER